VPVKLAFARLTIPDPAQCQLDAMLWLWDEVSDHFAALHADVVHILLAGSAITQVFEPFSILGFANLGALINRWLNGELVKELVMLQEHGVLHPAFKQRG
jgi:hypothetical protein